MFAGQREACLRVIEPFLADVRGLPVCRRVALRAVLSQATLVLVLMTRSATGGKPHPRMAQVLVRQQWACLRGNMLCRVTGSATYSRMLTVKHISRLRVVESGRSRIPVDHLEICAVVI